MLQIIWCAKHPDWLYTNKGNKIQIISCLHVTSSMFCHYYFCHLYLVLKVIPAYHSTCAVCLLFVKRKCPIDGSEFRCKWTSMNKSQQQEFVYNKNSKTIKQLCNRFSIFPFSFVKMLTWLLFQFNFRFNFLHFLNLNPKRKSRWPILSILRSLK